MRISIFNGDPKLEGETRKAIERFVDGVYDHYEDIKPQDDPALYVSSLHLSGMKISHCTRCDLCVGNPGRCVIKDEGQHAINKITNSEILMFATPIYWGGMSGLLKNFLDRCYALGDASYAKKRALLLTVGSQEGGSIAHGWIESQIAAFCRAKGMDLVASLHLDNIEKDDLDKAYALHEAIHR